MTRTSHLADLLRLLEHASTSESAPVLLPSARAAGELRWAFDRRQQELGRQAWYPAPALSWAQWIGGLWSETIVSGAENRILLNPLQEQSLWSEIIAADPATTALTSPVALAHLARSAWQSAASYYATGQLRSFAVTSDNRTFAGWATTFAQHCTARSYISAAQLEDALRRHLEAGTLAAPEDLHLAGFADLTPTQKALLQAFEDRGTAVVHHRLLASSLKLETHPDQPQPEQRRGPIEPTDDPERDIPALRSAAFAPSEREELALAAHWIRDFLEDGGADQASQRRPRRVAVLVPGLAQKHGDITAAFRQILAPELQSVEADLSSQPWEMTAGPALASLPVIAAALDLIRWLEAPLPIERVSELLRSFCLSGEGSSAASSSPATDSQHAASNDAAPRARREAVLRFDSRVLRRHQPLRPEISLNSLVVLLDDAKLQLRAPGARAALRWPYRLQTFLRRSGDLNRPRSYADWTEFIRETLRTVGWPGDVSGPGLGPTEFAATQAWESTLDLVATLDFAGRRVPFATVREALQREAESAVSALPSTHASVQVMSPEESAGCCFDATVLLRATGTNWPASEHAHPLLAWPLQRNLGMPGTDAGRAAARALRFATDLRDRSHSLLCTYALEDRDGPLRPSPLLAELGLPTVDLRKLVHPPAPAEAVPVEESIDDSVLPAPPPGVVPGGSSVLKLQAACGFLAFAQLRLQAAAPDASEIGLDARDSGNVLHKVLDRFWKTVGSQAALRAMAPHERRDLLASCIDRALERTVSPGSAWDVAYLAVQKDRQLSLLGKWMEQELRRGAFTVLQSEQSEQINLGPLRLSLRVDRVDQVEDGVVLVDYKTGAKADRNQWEGERPEEPQLPLYTLLRSSQEIQGLAFARVRVGREMRWNGYQASEGILPGRAPEMAEDLRERVAAWRATLTQLAEDFHAGRAEVRPKSYIDNCTHCAQRLLCRLDPATLLEMARDEDAGVTNDSEAASAGDLRG